MDFATIAANWDWVTLQKILGHSSITMTMRYAHLSPDHLADAPSRSPLASLAVTSLGLAASTMARRRSSSSRPSRRARAAARSAPATLGADAAAARLQVLFGASRAFFAPANTALGPMLVPRKLGKRARVAFWNAERLKYEAPSAALLAGRCRQ